MAPLEWREALWRAHRDPTADRVLPCWTMPKGTTPEQLRSWIEGQRIANDRQRETLAAMSAEEKLRQISRLMASARLFDMSRRAAGDRAVHELWQRLRERWPGGQ
jgi:hypothetical protein